MLEYVNEKQIYGIMPRLLKTNEYYEYHKLQKRFVYDGE